MLLCRLVGSILDGPLAGYQSTSKTVRGEEEDHLNGLTEALAKKSTRTECRNTHSDVIDKYTRAESYTSSHSRSAHSVGVTSMVFSRQYSTSLLGLQQNTWGRRGKEAMTDYDENAKARKSKMSL